MKKNQNYISISYDDLLIYSLLKLRQEKKHLTFENLVYKCFTLFPKRFQLPGYPEWPDSSLIEKSWVRCRADRLINGSKAKGFTLTSKGVFFANSVGHRILNSSNLKSLNKGDNRTRSGRLVKNIENSIAYKKFVKDKNVEKISDFEFCDLLYSTLDTEPVLRKRNLEELRYHAEVYERKDILDLLIKCEVRFKKLLVDRDRDKYQGGMMKRRIK